MTQASEPARGVLRMERDVIDVTSISPRPDPNWVYVDGHGHEHRMYDGVWSTLRRVVTSSYWCPDCGDEHEASHWACAVCGEPVQPGMVGPGLAREFVPGRARYWLDDVEIGEAEALAIQAERRANG